MKVNITQMEKHIEHLNDTQILLHETIFIVEIDHLDGVGLHHHTPIHTLRLRIVELSDLEADLTDVALEAQLLEVEAVEAITEDGQDLPHVAIRLEEMHL